ncbi:MAG TPA: hypothetical protein VII76_01375 [Acidimicrobiales bacterium]
MRQTRRGKWGTLVAASALAASLLTGAAEASATTPPRVTNGPAGLWWCDSTQAFCEQNVVTSGITNGTQVNMVCWDDGRANNNGSYPNRWIYVDLYNGQEGYLPIYQIANPVSTPRCSSLNWWNVANYAIARLGTPPAPADGVGNSWDNFCLTFASQAWSRAAGINIANPMPGVVAPYPTNGNTTPDQIWNYYWGTAKLNPYVHNESNGVTRPPRGALVFWSGSSPMLWHVAISLGNWQAIGTWDASVPGSQGNNLIYRYDVLTGGYTGWILPPGSSGRWDNLATK